MSTIPQQIQTLRNNISALRALVNGIREPGKLYAITGDVCIFGCKITSGLSASDMYLAIEGQSIGDEQHHNPDVNVVPFRHEEYANIALIYGDVFEMPDSNVVDSSNPSLLLDDAPGVADYGRYDLVYAYIGQSGPAVSIMTGTASADVKTDFVSNGLDVSEYPSSFDPTLPFGTLPLARVYVQTGDTGIADARIADLRSFKSRTNPISKSGQILLHTGLGLAAVDTAVRRFATIVENTCPGITMVDSVNNGTRFTASQSGLYKVAYTEIGQTSTSYAGISINSAQLSTSIESADINDVGPRIMLTSKSTTELGNMMECLIKLLPGDFFVCHNTVGSWSSESNLTRLQIEKILDL